MEKTEVLKAVPFSLFILCILPIICRHARLGKTERILITTAFSIRSALAILFSYKGLEFYSRDPIKYDYYATLYSSGTFDFQNSLNVICHSMFGAVLYFVFGPSEAIWAVFNSFVGALTIIVVFKITDKIFGNNEARIAIIIYTIFPSYVLFAATIQREAVVIFFIACSVWYFLNFMEKQTLGHFIGYVISLIFIGLLRPLDTVLLVGSAFPFAILKVYFSDTARKYQLLKPFIILFTLFFIGGGIGVVLLTPLGEAILKKLAEDTLVSVANARASGESSYLSDIKYTSFWSIIYYMPLKFIYFTFGPFLWGAKGIATLAAAMEGIFNFILILFSWQGFKELKTRNAYAAFFLVLFGLGSLAAQGAVDSNFATALRHRISFTFIFVILATYKLERSRGLFDLVTRVLMLRRPILVSSVLLFVFCSSMFFPVPAVGREVKVDNLPYEDGQVRIWSVGPVAKVGRFDDGEGRAGEVKGKIQLRSARNEYESFQIVVGNRSGKPIELKSFSVNEFSLEGDKSVKIGKDHVESFYVGYVNTDYPDVLFPAHVDKYRREFKDIERKCNLNLWLSVFVPDEARMGDYESEIGIEVGDTRYLLPLKLKVWDFALPRTTHVKTHLFAIDQKEVARRYKVDLFSDEYERLILGVFEEYRKHRISPGAATPVNLNHMHNAGKDPAFLGQYFEKWCSYWVDAGLDCNNINMPRKVENLGDYKYVYESVKKNGWSDRVYIRLPNDEAKKGVKAEENRMWAKRIRESMPGIKLHHTLGGLERGLNTTHVDYYSGSVDIWAFVPDAYLSDRNNRQAFDDRVKKGEKVSWYIHRKVNVWQPWDDLRFFFWDMWRHDVSMVTFWRTTFWSRPAKYKNFAGIEIPRVAEKKTWRENRGFVSTKSSGVGNGTLFWPDDDRILTSIRLEVIRDGIEDYEYLVLAGKNGIKVQAGDDMKGDFLTQRNRLGEQIEKSGRK